jgi:DNA modification methylase
VSVTATRQVAIKDLQPYPGNPRVHDIPAIRESLRANGQFRAIVVRADSMTILAGHGTVEAAREEGWKKLLAHLVDVDDEQARLIVLADNRTAELGGYDDQLLVSLLDAAPVLEGSGWDEATLKALKASLYPDRRGQDTEPPPLPKKPRSKIGEVYELGAHRLLCGDATQRSAIDRVLNGEDLAGAVVTDPPYGVAIGAKNRALDSIDRAGRVLTDLEGDQGIKQVEDLWRASFAVLADAIPPGTPYYIFGPQGGDLGLLLLLLLRDAGLSPRHILIWVKNRPSFSIGRLDYDYQHEPIVYGWRPGAAHPWHAAETQTSLLNFDRPAASKLHPTMKPVQLCERLIANSTRPGEMVLDPFGGSGSTLIACENLDRRCLMLELDPRYCDVIRDRYERHMS